MLKQFQDIKSKSKQCIEKSAFHARKCVELIKHINVYTQTGKNQRHYYQQKYRLVLTTYYNALLQFQAQVKSREKRNLSVALKTR